MLLRVGEVQGEELKLKQEENHRKGQIGQLVEKTVRPGFPCSRLWCISDGAPCHIPLCEKTTISSFIFLTRYF